MLHDVKQPHGKGVFKQGEGMEKWRFLEVHWLTYAETAIYRPVLMRAVSEEVVPDTVSFCTFARPSMVLNFFNDPDKEIDLDFCRQGGIPVCRVISSGGPIFGDTGYIFTFLHVKRNNPKIPPNAQKMFEKTLTGVARGISESFKIACRFRPLNDVEVRCEDGVWRKIGPSSCVYEEKAIQMGSGIQVKEPDTDLISRAIPTAPEKFMDKEAKSVQERITYLERVVGRDIKLDELREIYKESIEKIFHVTLYSGEFTEKEKSYYGEMEEAFTSDEFLMERSERKFGRVPAGVTRKAIQFKVPEGPFVRIIALTNGERIRRILISGTIHASPLRPTSPIHEIERALEGQPIDEELFRLKIEEILRRPNFHFAGVSPEFLAGKIYECVTQ
jgi:lipoate-protein ligase A